MSLLQPVLTAEARTPRPAGPQPQAVAWVPRVWIGFAVVAALGFFATRAFSPWHWFYDENGALFSYIGSNYLRDGFLATRGGMHHWTSFDGAAVQAEFYSTHPPLLGWLCGLAQWAFGVRPLSVRLVPTLAQLGSMIPLFLIGRRLFGRAAAAWGLFVYATLPMTAYFGFMVNFEPIANLFLLLGVYCYVRVNDNGWSWRWAVAMAVSLFAGMWTDWPVYFAAFAIGLDWFCSHRGWARLRCALPWGLGLAAFAMFLGFIYQLGGAGDGGVGSLLNALKNRSGIVPDEQYSLGKLAQFLGRKGVVLYGPGLLALVFGPLTLRTGRAARPVLVLVCVAVLNVAMFSYGAMAHEYWTYYLVGPAALGAMALACWWSAHAGAVWLECVAALWLVGQSAWVIHDYNSPVYAEWLRNFSRIGEAIAPRAKPGEVVMLSFDWGDGAAAGYSAQLPIVQINSTAQFERARRHPDFRGGYLVRAAWLAVAGIDALLDSFECIAEMDMDDSRVRILYVPPAVAIASGVAEDRPGEADYLPRNQRSHSVDAAAGRVDCLWPNCSRPNVILVLCESTGAEYCEIYGAPYANTPHLRRLGQHAVTFDRFFAHSGNSSRSLFALFCGTYPGPQHEVESSICPTIDLPSLPDLFRRAGYRTAVLFSSGLDFQSNRRFLAARGFDRVLDVTELKNRYPLLNWPDFWEDWAPDVVDDLALAPETLRIVDEDGPRPFFIVVYTYLPHYPYYPTTDPVDYVPDEEPGIGSFESYLNAIRNQDRMIGDLARGLDERGLTDSTVLVVTGDHGEAFGQHGDYVHGDYMYEQELRVPLVIINPLLFPEPLRSSVLGGHVDVAPTLTHLAGIESPGQWQGASLFATERPQRTYHMLAPPDLDDALFLGLHEGRLKYVFGPQHRTEELFDLATDPGERRNLASRPEYAPTVARLRRRVQSWAEFQGEYLRTFWDRSRVR